MNGTWPAQESTLSTGYQAPGFPRGELQIEGSPSLHEAGAEESFALKDRLLDPCFGALHEDMSPTRVLVMRTRACIGCRSEEFSEIER